jgi:hypothetical protein
MAASLVLCLPDAGLSQGPASGAIREVTFSSTTLDSGSGDHLGMFVSRLRDLDRRSQRCSSATQLCPRMPTRTQLSGLPGVERGGHLSVRLQGVPVRTHGLTTLTSSPLLILLLPQSSSPATCGHRRQHALQRMAARLDPPATAQRDDPVTSRLPLCLTLEAWASRGSRPASGVPHVKTPSVGVFSRGTGATRKGTYCCCATVGSLAWSRPGSKLPKTKTAFLPSCRVTEHPPETRATPEPVGCRQRRRPRSSAGRGKGVDAQRRCAVIIVD